MSTLLSPSVHEKIIARHMTDADDPILQSLHDAVKATREIATKAAQTTGAVLRNTMRTEPQNHREARNACFALLERATKSLDDALKNANAEIAAIQSKVAGPAAPKDLVRESREAELRERLAMLPEQRRKDLIGEAIRNGDDQLISAVLNARGWEVGLTDAEQQLHRHAWATKNYAADLNRLERLSKAVDDASRAGAVAVSFIDGLTNAEIVEKAEQMEKQASAALAAAK